MYSLYFSIFYCYNAFILFSLVCNKIIIECMICSYTLFTLQHFTHVL
nr:MAG TPA: hypothetical protein [Bacteriophage sp.]